jgi:uncharacterized repeat protein (TIGR03803 family)
VLYAFSGTPDGGSPASAVVFDHHGNLYGTTTVGGALGNGTVFKLTGPSRPGGDGTESILYSFTGESDGSNINAGVVFDAHGNLIGAATVGGDYGGGTIFQLTPTAVLLMTHRLSTAKGTSLGPPPVAHSRARFSNCQLRIRAQFPGSKPLFTTSLAPSSVGAGFGRSLPPKQPPPRKRWSAVRYYLVGRCLDPQRHRL